jgi:hypothetical protein
MTPRTKRWLQAVGGKLVDEQMTILLFIAIGFLAYAVLRAV